MNQIGERNLWDMIVNNDDITYTHILPRLDQNDIKFLYDVNSETRALFKSMPEAFRIRKLSSISTLEFAWNNMHWGTTTSLGRYELVMDQAWFCWQVARTNKLELLKWVREEKGCEWDANTGCSAAWNGNLEMVEYCLANQCPGDTCYCASAAQGGQLECLKYLREKRRFPVPWNHETADYAAGEGHLHILEYLVERKYDEYTNQACCSAAGSGHLDCLKYLHETAKAPWDSEAVRRAHKLYRPECLQYLLDNDCPLPRGWRYEDGELYSIETSEFESEWEPESESEWETESDMS